MLKNDPAINPAGTLYVVATPIGNLGDFSSRAIEVLKTADLIACEDTRTSAKLMQAHNIDTPLTAYHNHNETHKTAELIEKLQAGCSIALISDAGTPLVSDPGYRLTAAAHDAGVAVSPIVGACAAIAALSAAGLPSDKFYFYGFLPSKASQRTIALEALKQQPATMIFYESPHRILASLADMQSVLGSTRPACLCRELTKTFETVKKAPLNELYDLVASDPNQQKGEIVLVVAGGSQNDGENDMATAKVLLTRLVQDLPLKKAAALASELTGVKKNALYEMGLTLKKDG